jgi:hypothetical protein
LEVEAELLFCDQQAVALFPIAVKEMGIAVGAEVVAVLFDLADEGLKFRIPVEAAGEEERSFRPVFFKLLQDEWPAFGKLISRKYQRYLLFQGVAADDGPVGPGKRISQRFFFTVLPSASFAASR